MSEHLIWNELGNLHYNAGAYDQAIKAYKQALNLDNKFEQALHNLALAYFKCGSFKEAILLFKKCLDLLQNELDKAYLWSLLGDAYRQINESEEALQAYQMAVDLAPENVSFMNNLASLLQKVLKSSKTQDGGNLEINVMEAAPVNTNKAAALTYRDTEAIMQTMPPVSIPDKGPISSLTRLVNNTIQSPHEPIHQSRPEITSELVNLQIPESNPRRSGSNWGNGMKFPSQSDLESQKRGYFTEAFIEQIYPNPHQPRMFIDVTELVDSIREYGIIQPLIVTQSTKPNKYILISGERRLEAARQVGLSKVPVFVRDATERQLLELAIIENINRNNLTPLEQANALERMNEEFSMSQEELSAHVGKSRVAVSNSIRLTRLPGKVLRALDARRISERHAQALLSLPTMELQIAVLQQIIDADLSIRQTEALVRKCQNEKEAVDRVEWALPEQELTTESVNASSNFAPVQPLKEDTPASEADDDKTHSSKDILSFEQEQTIPEHPFPSEPPEKNTEFTFEQAEEDASQSSETPGEEKVQNEGILIENSQGIVSEILTENTNIEGKQRVDLGEEQAESDEQVTQPVKEDMIEFPFDRSEQVQQHILDSDIEIEPHLEHVLESSAGEDPNVDFPPQDQIRTSSITYKKITELNPRNDKAWEMLGGIYVSTRDYDNAIHAYQQAIAINPSIEEYHYRLGQVFILDQKYEEAIQEFLNVIELNADNIFAYCALASCYRHLGRDDEAQLYLDNAAPQIQNENPYNRACFESIRGNASEAIKLLRMALESKQTSMEQIRNDPDLDFIRGETLFEALLDQDVCEI